MEENSQMNEVEVVEPKAANIRVCKLVVVVVVAEVVVWVSRFVVSVRANLVLSSSMPSKPSSIQVVLHRWPRAREREYRG